MLRKRDKKKLLKYNKRSEEEKASDPNRRLYKGLQEKLSRAKRERDELRTDLN